MGTESRSEFRLMETRPRVLANFFRKSRDNWKRKYQEAKSATRALWRRVRDLEVSRTKWRERAEQTQSEQQRLREEVRQLKETIAAHELDNKKK